jgi:uncharacterized protein (TIGR02145 family)
LYRPTQVLKGTTRNANNTGFYRFYCVATDASGVELTSDVAEVAVGCGGKTKEGKWLSFMCFNLGADNNTDIDEQKTYNIGTIANDSYGKHDYITGEENVYGDLFQWGRIADDHEKRTSTGVDISSVSVSDIGDGGWCSSNDTQHRPVSQIKSGTSGYGKFITGVGAGTNYSWNPASTGDLWRAGRNLDNDPCAHYKSDGNYHPFWHANGMNSSDPACGGSSDSWRLPTQAEWSELYRGGTIFGIPNDAEANTWHWNEDTNKPHGYELRPDNVTTTLFLPASGNRRHSTGLLYYQGSRAMYWSSTAIGAGADAHILYFHGSYVNPADMNSYAYGSAIRCIKN